MPQTNKGKTERCQHVTSWTSRPIVLKNLPGDRVKISIEALNMVTRKFKFIVVGDVDTNPNVCLKFICDQLLTQIALVSFELGF